ncbi:hypothetical protein [Nonomuraea sp. NPDC002799]
MHDEVNRPLPVDLLGSIDAPSAMVTGFAAEQWSRPTSCVLASLDGEFVAFDRASFFAGNPAVVDRRPREPGAMAALTPDGTTLVVAAADSIRAFSGDRLLWEHRHGRWSVQGFRAPGQIAPRAVRPAVSPDGTRVSVLVAGAETDPNGTRRVWSTWLLLDTVTGGVLAEHRLGFPTLEVTQRWHADSRHLTISRWVDWESWRTMYVDMTEQPLRTRWILGMREVTDLLSPSRILSLRRAEYIAAADDRAEVTLHEITGSQEREVARLDVLRLGGGFNEEPHDVRGLGSDHVLFSPGASHLLLDAEGLRPLGRLDYPDGRAGPSIAPLPDGTWLTTDTSGEGIPRLRHWALA